MGRGVFVGEGKTLNVIGPDQAENSTAVHPFATWATSWGDSAGSCAVFNGPRFTSQLLNRWNGRAMRQHGSVGTPRPTRGGDHTEKVLRSALHGGGRTFEGCLAFQFFRQVRCGGGTFYLQQSREWTLVKQLTTTRPALGPEFDDVVGFEEEIEMMLDH